jgi:glycosyltransferase involved in cell wall biosynthesis
MQLSVVVPTLNGREHLVTCLDALTTHAPAAEVIVVNGPSVDGTTGTIRERNDVDVLVELDERNINVARNAGIDRASGDVIAFVDYWLAIEQGWIDTIQTAFEPLAQSHRASGHGSETPGAITGPIYQSSSEDVGTETAERRTIGTHRVTYFQGGNVVFRKGLLESIDGFDEYLATGGARDAAHRLARLGYDMRWRQCLSVRQEAQEGISGVDETQRMRADGGEQTKDWHWRYRSLTYRLTKNYGIRSLWRVARHAAIDAGTSLPNIARGNTRPSGWLTNGRKLANGSATGVKDGLIARLRDRTPQRNHRGLSTRTDRAVAVYDRR